MAITWRVPVLVLLGIGPVVLRPEAGTVWLWLLLVVVLVTLDVVIAPSPTTLSVVRRPVQRTRQGDATTTTLEVTAGGRRIGECCAMPGNPLPGRPTTGTASTWPRERASRSPPGCTRSGGVTWPPTG